MTMACKFSFASESRGGQTFIRRVPAAHSSKMATRLYGKELKEFDDVDVDALLAKLTPEELEELNFEVDPDNALLPPSQRCREQTARDPTGPLNRDKLLHFLEEKAKNEKDWDERVPFQPGVKRGKSWEPKEKEAAGDDDMPIELDLDEELDDALASASECDLVDIAGIMGLHSMLSQPQFQRAVEGKSQDESSGLSFGGLVKATAQKLVPDEPPNATDVDDCVERLRRDDATLTEVNVNNMKHLPHERIAALVDAARHSTHLRSLCLANTAVADKHLPGLVELVEQAACLTTLNVESNFLSPDLLAKLLRAAAQNQTLVEFRAENQRASVLGNQIEMDMMQSIEANDVLLRVGVAFDSMMARHRVAEALERNYERLRLNRVDGDA